MDRDELPAEHRRQTDEEEIAASHEGDVDWVGIMTAIRSATRGAHIYS